MRVNDGDRGALEFSRVVALDDIEGGGPVRLVFVATDDECAALARRFAIAAIESLRAEVTLGQTLTGDIVANGEIRAHVVQACVVTLDPVANDVATTFAQRFSYRPDDEGGTDEDPPEPIVDNAFEIGEVIAQNLSLALDPYPRASGVEFDPAEIEDGDGPANPFAALARLRRGDKGREG